MSKIGGAHNRQFTARMQIRSSVLRPEVINGKLTPLNIFEQDITLAYNDQGQRDRRKVNTSEIKRRVLEHSGNSLIKSSEVDINVLNQN